MVTTKPVAAGEQIVCSFLCARLDNPNSELLRRYGHIDLLSLPRGGMGNPGDVVEIPADIVIDVLSRSPTGSDQSKERVDWWLEEGGDE
jgi:N-lysine methyltransferase SETD6